MSSDCCLHQVIKPEQVIQIFLRLTLVAHATNVISEPFPWLILNSSRKTCLALQYIGVVVCNAAFSIKISLF